MSLTTNTSRMRSLQPASYTTGPLKLTLEGSKEPSPGDWLLRKFAETNAQHNPFEGLKPNAKRPWWRFW